MRNICPSLIFLLLSSSLFAQNLQLGWGYTNGSTGADGANDLVLDAAGNTYVTGYFSGTVDFDKGPGTANLSVAPGQNAKDAFVLKLDAQGNYVWAIRIGGIDNYDQVGTKIALDTAGNVVVSGTFFGNVLLPPNNTNYNSSTTLPGSFMVKIDAAGTALWSRAWCNTTSEMIIEDFTIDANNRIVAVGEFTATLNFSTNATPNSKTSNGGKDFFVMQLGQNGNLQNVQSAGNVNDEYANAITVVNNQYWVSGSFKGTVDFNFGSAVNNLVSNNSTYDVFTLRLNGTLGYLDVLHLGGNTNSDVAKGVANFNDSSAYQFGGFNGSVDFNPSSGQSLVYTVSDYTPFVQKFDNTGNLKWARAFQFTSNSTFRPVRMAISRDGDIFLVCEFGGTIDVDPNPNNSILLTAPSTLVHHCLIHLDSSGTFVSRQILDAYLGYYRFGNLVVLDAARINMCGNFNMVVDLDPGPMLLNVTPEGSYDMLILKLISCSDTIVNTAETACGSYILSNGQTISQSGTYNDTLQTTLGCDSVVARAITINPLPNTALVWQGGTLLLVNGSSTNTHTWIDCGTGQPITGATGISYTPTGNGSFAVVVNNGNCTDTSICESLTNFSLPEASSIPIKLYPNPTSGLLRIESPQPWQKVEVVDMLGKIVYKSKKEEIDLTHLPAGMYLVKVYFEEGVVVERVIKD
jgi:hypothetical protein